jgi:hypothetical protein
VAAVEWAAAVAVAAAMAVAAVMAAAVAAAAVAAAVMAAAADGDQHVAQPDYRRRYEWRRDVTKPASP